MNKLLEQKGFVCLNDDEMEVRYFYTPAMMKDNVLIEIGMMHTDAGPMDECISVKHYHDQDAFECQLYWGTSIEPIQEYRIIMDVFDMYRTFPVELFRELVVDMSGSYHSASMQTGPQHAERIMKDTKEYFKKVRALAARAEDNGIG